MAHLVDRGVEEHLELVAHPFGRVRADEVGEEVLKRLGRRKVREGGDVALQVQGKTALQRENSEFNDHPCLVKAGMLFVVH